MARKRVIKTLILNSAFIALLFWGKMVSGDPSPEQRLSLTSRTVRTKYGDVSGVIVTLDSRHLEPVEVFRGIPYASPPIGSLRFMPPVTGALWSGVKIADKFSPVCPQRLPNIFNETAALKRMPRGRLEYLKRLLPYLQNQSEDCLYLNIYAPAQGNVFFISNKPPIRKKGILQSRIYYRLLSQLEHAKMKIIGISPCFYDSNGMRANLINIVFD
ncbi:hypothetical protein PPYR_09078 [Photinus pyralis]|uniref:Carboxylesterase type B domain-containing protein n=1 Tax=Photinus pyralis TaxID=7054 RepID=A0A5N4AL50_PHOPY|nr:hypothetical protein PPYR_09078 [Photinus pyralis]